MRAIILLASLLLAYIAQAAPGPLPACQQYRVTLTREAQTVYGINAPIPMLAAQLHQESGCRANITAWDKGRGVAQFMDDTAVQIAHIYPDLGKPDPYNPVWAIRAQALYDAWLYKRVVGADDCQRWGAALKSYNAGLGYAQKAQRKAGNGTWFGGAENINAGQSQKNFEYSKQYPRTILQKHQPRYASWGTVTCREIMP